MLSEAEMSTLKEALQGTEHKETLDRKAEKILSHYTKELENAGFNNLKAVIKEGHPLEEILKVSKEEAVDLIIVGCSSKSRLQRMVTGCVSKDLESASKVPVLIAKGAGCGLHAHTWSRKAVYAVR
jgi:nucleotide-binding universal stress UspA family protein